MTIEQAKDQVAKKLGYKSWYSMEYYSVGLLDEAIRIYGEAQAKEAYNQAIRDAANSAIIKGKKKSVHSKKPRWKNIEENEEVDLFSYEVQYSVNKQSILKLLK